MIGLVSNQVVMKLAVIPIGVQSLNNINMAIKRYTEDYQCNAPDGKKKFF